MAEPQRLVEQLLEAREQLSKFREAAFYGEEVLPLLRTCAEGRKRHAEHELAELARQAGGELRVDMGGWALTVTA